MLLVLNSLGDGHMHTHTHACTHAHTHTHAHTRILLDKSNIRYLRYRIRTSTSKSLVCVKDMIVGLNFEHYQSIIFTTYMIQVRTHHIHKY